MTGFLTALLSISTVIRLCKLPRLRQVKGASGTSVLCGHTCRERLNTEVWNYLFILSVLGAFTMPAVTDATPSELKDQIEELQVMLEVKGSLNLIIRKSDASLYAPTNGNIDSRCVARSLYCYLLELLVILEEEKQYNRKNQIQGIQREIATVARAVQHECLPVRESDRCPPCEAHELTDSVEFLQRFRDFLVKISTCFKSR